MAPPLVIAAVLPPVPVVEGRDEQDESAIEPVKATAGADSMMQSGRSAKKAPTSGTSVCPRKVGCCGHLAGADDE